MTKLSELETPEMREDLRGQASSALGDWYSRIREKEIEDLDDDDVCRACRQGLYPDMLVPIALARLGEDPLAGDMYDGEMLVSLTGVSSQYWASNKESRQMVRRILAGIRGELHADMADDITRLEALIAKQ